MGTLIHFAESELDRALTAVDGRAAGTCELSPCETLEETLALARKKGAGRVLVLAAAWPLLEEIGQKIGSIAG